MYEYDDMKYCSPADEKSSFLFVLFVLLFFPMSEKAMKSAQKGMRVMLFCWCKIVFTWLKSTTITSLLDWLK